MRFFVGLTDRDWYRFLAAEPRLEEVNFWQPSGAVEFKALLQHGLKGFNGQALRVPRVPGLRPNPAFLEERYEVFRKAG